MELLFIVPAAIIVGVLGFCTLGTVSAAILSSKISREEEPQNARKDEL